MKKKEREIELNHCIWNYWVFVCVSEKRRIDYTVPDNLSEISKYTDFFFIWQTASAVWIRGNFPSLCF